MTIAADLLAEAQGDEDRFLDRLLDRMTCAEQLGQLCLYAIGQDPASDPYNPTFHTVAPEERLAAVRRGVVGGFFSATGVAQIRRLQRIAVDETRLGIPLVFAADVIHGFRTVFPVPLAEAAAFDPDLAERTARAAATEAAAAGLDWTFAPGVDVARDARWGRMVESAGEDPLLAARLSAARVRGYQTQDLSRADAVMATAKHFAGYGAAEGGIDYAGADLGWQTLRDVHLPPFQAAVAAGVGAVMTAFNELDGIPCTAHPRLLDGVLRGEWAFAGLIVSDFTSDVEMIAHGYAQDMRDAARLALLAGLDVTLESGLFGEHGADLVEAGEVAASAVRQAARRMLRAKLRLGLFADPFRRLDPAREAASHDDRAARTLAREAAARCVVLLKNAGDVLPLGPGPRVALVGPFAGDHDLNGAWSLFAQPGASIGLEQGLRAALGDARVTVAPGCDIEAALPGGLAGAAAAVAAADVAVLALGESERWSGEARSRAGISLPAAQLDLARAVRALGKPVVLLLRTGRALPIAELAELADAVLVTWFLGSETGHAVADVLTGRCAPTGRLPVSFPRHPAQLPLYYGHKPSGRPAGAVRQPFTTRYDDVAPAALFPFGFGLTYTTFAFGPTSVDAANLVARARVANTGARAGEVLVQLYVRDVAASVTRPVRELKAWRRIALEPGESRQVDFRLSREDLSFWRQDGTWGFEPGVFEMVVADNAAHGLPVRVTIGAD